MPLDYLCTTTCNKRLCVVTHTHHAKIVIFFVHLLCYGVNVVVLYNNMYNFVPDIVCVVRMCYFCIMEDNGTYKILFVCLGNICRSPAAEGVMKHVVKQHGCEARYFIDSAGTYGGHAGELPDPRMRRAAAHRGYLLEHRAKRFKEAMFAQFDLIVVMDDNNYYDVQSMAPTVDDEKKIVRMTDYCRHYTATYVPDPYYEGAAGFELVLNLLEDACQGLLSQLEGKA